MIQELRKVKNLKSKYLNREPNNGFTLLEVLIVIAIVGFVSTIGTYKFIAFQQNSELTAFAEEFASTLKTAKNKSINGEILPSQNLSDFRDPDGLPYWGVSVSTGSYSLTENCVKPDGTLCDSPNVETTNLKTGYSFTSSGNTDFERLTGKMTGTGSYILRSPGNQECAKVSVGVNGYVSITKSCS